LVRLSHPLRPPDFEAEANILRCYTTADVGREYGTGARLSQYVDVIGSFTQALLCGLRQLDNGPQNFRPGIHLDDRSKDCFHQIECMPRSDGQQVGSRRWVGAW
jgi:hypothetical protein